MSSMAQGEWEAYCQTLRELTQRAKRAERERDEARLVIREFLASGVEHDDPRMDYITMQVDRVTIDAARAAEGGGDATPNKA